MDNQVALDPHPDKVVITEGLRGFFAVHITWDDKMGGYEPYQSGTNSYKTKDDPDLLAEVVAWAQAEGIGCEV